MNENIFTITLIIIEIIFTFMVLKALHNVGAKKPMLAVLGIVLIGWLITDYLLIINGFFSATGMSQVAFTAAVVIPTVVGFLAISFYQPLKQVVNRMGTETFLLLQHMRSVFGVLFFFTAALPLWFQLLGGLGDIAAGIGAFLALRYYRNNPDNERQAIVRGNFAGILDFILVISFGVLVVLRDSSPDIMFDLIPLYVVPQFILFHIFSLKLLAKEKPGRSKPQASLV